MQAKGSKKQRKNASAQNKKEIPANFNFTPQEIFTSQGHCQAV
jgi:hypothetical protein